jgi:transcriptional regulator with XRE-family HTH domain
MASKRTKPKTPKTLTEALRQAIAESGLSFQELQRRTGVVRQSLMKFARGEQSLRLDHADKLATFFNIEVIRRTTTTPAQRQFTPRSIARIAKEST